MCSAGLATFKDLLHCPGSVSILLPLIKAPWLFPEVVATQAVKVCWANAALGAQISARKPILAAVLPGHSDWQAIAGQTCRCYAAQYLHQATFL